MSNPRMNDHTCKYPCYLNIRKTEFKHNRTNKIRMMVFDMDGVLVDIYSSWRYIHSHFNTSNHESVEKYLKGEIDDLEFIKRDLNLWKNDGKFIKFEELEKILKEVPIMKGAEGLITFLKDKNIKTGIVSAGLDVLAQRVKETLDIDYSISNGFYTDETNRITNRGKLRVKLMYKDQAIKQISDKSSIPLENIASVGNSCFDIPMLQVSGLGIAFNPADECIKKYADIIIKEKDLGKISEQLNNFLL